MISKTILILIIVAVIVVGSIVTGPTAFAQKKVKTLETECADKKGTIEAFFCEAIFALQDAFEALQVKTEQLIDTDESLQDQIDNISAGLTVDLTTGDVDVGNDLTVAGSVTVGSAITIDGTNNKITGSAATEIATTTGAITIDPGDNGLVLTIGTDGTIDSASIDSTSIVDGSIALADLAGDSVNSAKIVDGSIVLVDLSFDTATQTELDSHAADPSVHHDRYTDAEAVTAVGPHTDLGTIPTEIVALQLVSHEPITVTNIQNFGFELGPHTVDTTLTEVEVDAFVANNGFSLGPHYTDADAIAAVGVHTSRYTNAEAVTAVGPHTASPTQTDIEGLGFVTGAHTVDTDTNADVVWNRTNS